MRASEATVGPPAEAHAPWSPPRRWTGAFVAAIKAARDVLPKGRSLPTADWERRHRWLVALVAAHAVVLPAFGIWRGYRPAHVALEAAAIALLAGAAMIPSLSHRWRGALAAVGLVTSSAVLVHFSGGSIEAHFHFFVVIIVLTLYEDWIPFLIAFGYVVAHHGVAGTLAPQTVYNHDDAIANPWKWAMIHGAFVSAAGLSAIVAWRLNEVTRARAGDAIARAVETQHANELKDRFLATTSHELRTPLTSISGFAKTLTSRWPELDDSQKLSAVEIIEHQADRLADLIDELLLLSALRSGAMRVDRQQVAIAPIVDRIVASFGPETEIVVDVPPDVTACVDERYFAQVVENYLSNARKYGAPPITVSARQTSRWLELSVSDRGPGVPDGFVSQLFEPFRRAHDSPGVRGSGLGLSIVHGLVEAQGGDAWYERLRPRGSCFKARFPLTDEGSSEDAAESLRSPAG